MSLTVPVQEIVTDSNDPLLAIHPSWERVPLGAIAEILNGFAFKSAFFNKSKGISLLRIRDVGKDRTECFYEGAYEPRYIVRAGDLIVGMDSDFKCGRWKGPDALLNQRVCKIELITRNYELSFLNIALPGYLRAINERTSSQTVRHLSSQSIAEIPLPLPPLAEQKRIVAKVEELLGRVKATKERLARVSMILKRFRQAVLSAACSGRLTADWREQQTILESASVLLSRLQQQHPRMDNSGFLENDLPEIPDNWVWAKVGQLGDVTTGSTPSKKEASYFGGSIPFFKPTDLDAGYNVVKSIDSLTEQGAEVARILPPSAVMVTCIGATIGKTGLGRVVGAANQQINSVVTNHEFVSPYWLFWTFTSPWVQEQIKLHASETTLPILNKGRFEKLFLPLPPLTEQKEIVLRVEAMFKLADAVMKRVAAATIRSKKLTQAILNKAFRGELVPTEAELARREGRSYEPASVLLARIKVQRKSKGSEESVKRI